MIERIIVVFILVVIGVLVYGLFILLLKTKEAWEMLYSVFPRKKPSTLKGSK